LRPEPWAGVTVWLASGGAGGIVGAMRFIPFMTVAACAALGLGSAAAVGAQEAQAGGAEQPPAQREALQQKLGEALTNGDAELLAEARELADEAGMSAQAFLENQAIGVLYTRADALAGATLEELKERRADWDFGESGMMQSEATFEAVMEALRARLALSSGDRAGFERHVKEAFWLEPQLAQILTGWITQVRQSEAMAAVRFPLETAVKTSAGETVVLAELVEGEKALLLDFWASWCGPCMQLMPELKKKHEELAGQGVVVAGMNTEGVAEAARVKERLELPMPWLVEPQGRPFSQLLGIDSIPRMVLVGADGQVLYNGHPMDPALKDALAAVGATLETAAAK